MSTVDVIVDQKKNEESTEVPPTFTGILSRAGVRSLTESVLELYWLRRETRIWFGSMNQTHIVLLFVYLFESNRFR